MTGESTMEFERMFASRQPFKQQKPGIRWKPELGQWASILRSRGMTYREMGFAIGVSTERARQILLHHYRIERGKCRHCNPEYFWIGDIFFGTFESVNNLDRYEREGHEPIEMMADVSYEARNPR